MSAAYPLLVLPLLVAALPSQETRSSEGPAPEVPELWVEAAGGALERLPLARVDLVSLDEVGGALMRFEGLPVLDPRAVPEGQGAALPRKAARWLVFSSLFSELFIAHG